MKNPRNAAHRVMAKMALIDGHLAESERRMLRDLVGDDAAVSALVDEVAPLDLQALIEPIEFYADRFFVAFRVYLMAHADDHYSDEERRFFDSLRRHLDVSDVDLRLIEETEAAIRNGRTSPPRRFLELYALSSFFDGETA